MNAKKKLEKIIENWFFKKQEGKYAMPIECDKDIAQAILDALPDLVEINLKELKKLFYDYYYVSYAELVKAIFESREIIKVKD